MKANFNRQEYLDIATLFESETLDDVEKELSEFNEDVEDMAYDLAYTRYALAKTERELAALRLVRAENEAGRINEEWWANMVADRERLKAELAELQEAVRWERESKKVRNEMRMFRNWPEAGESQRSYLAARAAVDALVGGAPHD